MLGADDEVAATVSYVIDGDCVDGAVKLRRSYVCNIALVELEGRTGVVGADVPGAVAVGVSGGFVVAFDVIGRGVELAVGEHGSAACRSAAGPVRFAYAEGAHGEYLAAPEGEFCIF